MVIGATPASDSAILAKASDLYRTHQLRRVYYSAFSPIPHAASELPVKPAPLVREHRLYQADWLMRFYGFSAPELTTPEEQDLPLDADPKLVWALRNREFFPVDVNAASREALLRVPGFGVRAVDRMSAHPALSPAHSRGPDEAPPPRKPRAALYRDSRYPGAPPGRGRLADRIVARPEQLALFPVSREALTGEF